MTRAISTVLDVTVCLLLVSAAVGTLLVTDPPTVEGSADETAEQLAGTTATVAESGGARERRVHGTHAELLARAAMANLTLDGQSLAPTTAGFRVAVRERVARVLDRVPSRTAVTARWCPYPNAPIQGRMAVGPAPPGPATVSTARFAVPLSLGTEWAETDASYGALARALSDGILRHTLPGRHHRQTPAERVDDRSRAYDRALGARPGETRRRVLATRLARDMRDRFASPGAAADAVRPAVVRVVVREWEA